MITPEEMRQMRSIEEAQAPPTPQELFKAGRIEEAEAAARAVGHYLCLHCGQTAPKDDWGPGRVTCPGCRKFAPSAEEARRMFPPAVAAP